MQLKDRPEWEKGDRAVEAVSDWLIAQGKYVLRTDRIETGAAPGFDGPLGHITVADLLAAYHGQLEWHEVKWKDHCPFHQKSRTWRQGIDAGKWRYYLWLQNATGVPGWLTMVQLRPGAEAEPRPVLLTAPFDLLCARLLPHDGGGDVKVWWEVDEFAAFPITLRDGWQTIDVGPPLIRPWERKAKDGHAPQWTPRPRLSFPPNGTAEAPR